MLGSTFPDLFLWFNGKYISISSPHYFYIWTRVRYSIFLFPSAFCFYPSPVAEWGSARGPAPTQNDSAALPSTCAGPPAPCWPSSEPGLRGGSKKEAIVRNGCFGLKLCWYTHVCDLFAFFFFFFSFGFFRHLCHCGNNKKSSELSLIPGFPELVAKWMWRWRSCLATCIRIAGAQCRWIVGAFQIR